MRVIRPMTADVGDYVWIYRNLHNGLWSVCKRNEHGHMRVAGHVMGALVADATFHVNPSGQKRVRDERKKHVHAYLRGTLEGWHAHRMGRSCYPDLYGTRVTYNPYEHDTFVVPDTLVPVHQARWAQVNGNGTLEIGSRLST